MSSSKPPPAEGVRVDWDDLPLQVREMIERRLGGAVVEASTQPGGFSPGLATRLKLDDGLRFFVKAVSESANPDTPRIHRSEARIVAALPESAPAPRFLWSFDEGGWVALCFEDIDGRHPSEPWTEADLALVVATLKQMAIDLTPSPIASDESARAGFARSINGWRRAQERGEDRFDAWCTKHLSRLSDLESRAPEAVDGETLLHLDIRADNLLIAGDRVYVIDWPWARKRRCIRRLAGDGAERRDARRPEPGIVSKEVRHFRSFGRGDRRRALQPGRVLCRGSLGATASRPPHCPRLSGRAGKGGAPLAAPADGLEINRG